MKNSILRTLSMLALVAMMLSLFTACPAKEDDGTLDNGNVITVTEEGSEEELTAVRDNLIKLKETQGFGDIDKMELYENGVRTVSDQYVQVKDNKKFYYSGDTKRLVNYTDGYILDMPADWVPDFSVASARCEFKNDDVTLVVSDETEALSIYGNSEEALKAMFRYINKLDYINANRIEFREDEYTDFNEEFKSYVLRLHIEDALEGTKSYYTYAVFYNELKMTYMMFKCVDDRDFAEVYNTYQSIYQKGAPVDTIAYPEGANPNWTDETKALYDRMMTTDKVIWGMVNGNIEQDPLKIKYPMLEKQLDHKFEVVTSYSDQMSFDFDVDAAREIYDDGRIVQFTYHFAYDYGNSNTMGNTSATLDAYRGECDEYFRKFAKSVVELGEPMLLRVNNEMNSDWTTWSATNMLNDTEIFCETWKRFYNILEEEGANQYLIWVWNPQGHSTGPMFKWNDLRMYFPGANYVHMLGLTGYNFGDDNQWTSFGDMYQALSDYYTPYFGDWAWIIGEFGCSDSSTNPDNANRKAEWITEMFDCFEQNRFPNIKSAVWFNGNDMDGQGNVTHEIALGRDKASQEAFKEGLDRTQ
ncbi:MAG: hypothetical protein IJC52_04370 [Clostridia bacterium]|nr:hypothetical protein [Clostridia bacterium]